MQFTRHTRERLHNCTVLLINSVCEHFVSTLNDCVYMYVALDLSLQPGARLRVSNTAYRKEMARSDSYISSFPIWRETSILNLSN